MIRKTANILLATAGLCAVFANPQIKVDKTAFSGGTIVQDKDTLIQAEFKYTNTGTEPLRISSVRVSCGCTVVSYDTVVAPGKTGVIKPKVNTKGFRPGQGSRSVTIMSNAANTPSLSLSIDYTVVAPVEVSSNHVHFEGAGKASVFLASAKKDLKVSGVVFKPQSGGNQWASNVSTNMGYTLAPADSTRADGFKVYKLELDAPPGVSPVMGEIKITTNHPERRELILVAD